MPKIYIIAGANGAGKSTFSKDLGNIFNIPIIDPDAIARKINAISPESVAVLAGKTALNTAKQYVSDLVSFGVETTLAGKGYLKLMKDLKNSGWSVHLIYIGIESPAINIQRVEARVKQGGHNVPIVDISRRYYRSLDNLTLAVIIADSVTIYDNSERQFQLIATIESGTTSIHVERCPSWYAEFSCQLPQSNKHTQN
jgi:predicted ABC-type ATPase